MTVRCGKQVEEDLRGFENKREFICRLGAHSFLLTDERHNEIFQNHKLPARDRVACPTEFHGEFLLCETKTEPLMAKLPAGQADVRLPEGAWRINWFAGLPTQPKGAYPRDSPIDRMKQFGRTEIWFD